MIPRRQGIADINLTIPTGNGQLPPIPMDAVGDAPVAQLNTVVEAPTAPVAPSTSRSNQILEALVTFSKVTKLNSVSPAIGKELTEKKLIVTSGGYGVVSEKGLKYLVDFTL